MPFPTQTALPPKRPFVIQVVFKCLLIEKLKVERKEAISEQMSDHPFSHTPKHRVTGSWEPPPTLSGPTRVDSQSLHSSLWATPERPAAPGEPLSLCVQARRNTEGSDETMI